MVDSALGVTPIGVGSSAYNSKLTKDLIESQSPYSMNSSIYSAPPMAYDEPPKKHGSFLGFLGKTILTAAVVVGGAVAARKFLVKGDPVAITKDSKIGVKAKYYFQTYTDKVIDFCKSLPSKIKFKKKAKPEAETNQQQVNTNA